MANVSTYLQNSLLNKLVEVAAYIWGGSFSLAATGMANGDRVRLFEVTRNMRLFQAVVSAAGTLGANATIKLQRDRAGNYVDLTVATTAGGASRVSGITVLPVDLAEGDFIVLLVGGADIGTAAVVEVDMLVQSK